MTRMTRRSTLLAWLLGSMIACGSMSACSVPGKTLQLHPFESEGARALWQVAFIREFTIPENYRFQTEEYAAVAADPARGLVYVGSRDGSLLALDDRKGEVVWEQQLGGGISSVPVLIVVEAKSGEGEGEAAGVRARPCEPGERPSWMLLGTDDGALVALDLDQRTIVWQHLTSGVVRNAPVLGEGVVHFVNSRDEVLAVDVASGEWVWEFAGQFQKDFTVFGRAGLAYLAPREAGEAGVIYSGFADGRVIALQASSGSTLWSEPLAAAGTDMFVDVDTTPLLVPARGELLVANQATGVYALGLEDGARRWNTPIRAVGSLVAGPGDLVVAASSLEGLHGLEFDGRVRWRQQLDPGSLATPLVVNDVVYVAHSDVGLLAYAIEDGELLGRLDNGSGSSGQPVFDPVLGRLYATSDRGQLYALSLEGL